MATTPNYGFIMPDPTDFVTNLPADFEIFGDEVDSRIKALNPETTAGDISYRGATADAKVRLGIGTANQVLAVNSGGTAPEWKTISSGGLTLLSTTTLSTTTTTISSISQAYTNLLIEISLINLANAGTVTFDIKNGATSLDLRLTGAISSATTTRSVTGAVFDPTNATNYTQADPRNISIISINNYSSTTSRKGLLIYGSFNDGSRYWSYGGSVNSNSAVNEITIAASQTFNGGTVRIWGVS